MKNILQRTFALSDKGVNDLIKASSLKCICDMLLMALNGVVYLFLVDNLVPVLEGNTPTNNLLVFCVYGLVFLAVLWFFYYLQYNSAYLCAYEESATKRISLAETLRKLPLSFFGKRDLSDVTTTLMTDTTTLENAFSRFIPELLGAVSSTLIFSIGLLFINVKMALSVLWVLPIAFLLCIASKKHQDKYGLKAKKVQLVYLSKLRECIQNIKDIKSNKRETAHLEEMKISLDNYEKYSVKNELTVGIYIVSAQLILKVGVATTMLAGIHLLANKEIDILIFIMFLFVVTRIYDSIGGALQNISATFNAQLSIERVKELESISVQTGVENISNIGYDITFEDVVFSYNNNENVLNGLTFTAKQGEVTALVGPSGGGKSTAIKLASRFWDISSGKITLGGEDISEIDPETLLKNYSIVFQDVTLFNNTVMENIRIGKKDATDDEVIQVAKEAKCHNFVSALPNGYETLIGENGSLLSGGERQRISIARALLKDAPIILLDEATSSVDILNETELQQAISRLTKNKTVIVIAHRMRTIAGADKIILLKDGKVANEGTHAEMMKQSCDYQKMVNLQNESMNWSLK